MTNRLFFVNSLVKHQQSKATMDPETIKKVNMGGQNDMKRLTLEDFEQLQKRTLEKHFNSKKKHKGFKKKLKLVLRND